MTFECDGAFRVYHRAEVKLDRERSQVVVDGVTHSMNLGMWMFFVAATGEKFFHARDGATNCIHWSAPTDFSKDCTTEHFSDKEWREALTKPVDRRLAEILIASQRLATAGLGPKVLGISVVDAFYDGDHSTGPTAGLIVENINNLPEKQKCADADVVAAGVTVDSIRSCVRQQIRGYVMDLCSTIGCMPIDAEDEIAVAHAWISTQRGIDHRAKNIDLVGNQPSIDPRAELGYVSSENRPLLAGEGGFSGWHRRYAARIRTIFRPDRG